MSKGNGQHPDMLSAALAYAARGWPVLPMHTPDTAGKCSCGKPDCKGKHPRNPNGTTGASSDLAVIRQWWTQWPDANIGLVCGDGRVALDFESVEMYSQWRELVGPLADSLPRQRSGKGKHVVFQSELPVTTQTLAFFADGKTKAIETRALAKTEGKTPACIMADPSQHPNGQRYEIESGSLNALPVLKAAEVERLLDAARKLDQRPRPEAPNPFSDLVIPAAQIAATEPQPVEWLTRKFIERGELVLLTAPGGSMKSLLMLDWAVSVATGRPWLTSPDGMGGMMTRPATVLWVNTDNSETTHADRLRAILRARKLADAPLFSLTTTALELAKPEHIKGLHLLANDLGAEVIVIDTLSGALTGIDENSAKEMTTPAANLRALASVGRTVIGIHHPPKSDKNGSRGSSVLPNKVDRVYSLARDGDLLTVKPEKIRNSPAQPITPLAALESDSQTEALLAVRFWDGRAARQDRAEDALRARVREALEGQDADMPLTKLRAACKCRMEDLKRVLLAMRGEVAEADGLRNAKLYRLK